MHECMYRYRPLGLLFNGTGGTPGDGGGDGGAGGGNDGGAGDGGNNAGDLGFPPNTPWRDMQPAEQTAYWQHQAKKHERTAESRRDYDALKADSLELAKERAKNQTQAEKDLDDARRQGENLGAQRYLDVAVEGHLIGATGKSLEDVKAALAFVDTSKLLDDKGDLDAEKIKALAATLGTSAPKEDPKPPAGGAIRRELRQAGGVQPKATSGSLKDRVRTRAAELSKSSSTSTH